MHPIQLIINLFSRHAGRPMKRYCLNLFASMTLWLAACGQPGPLYLPKDEPPAQQPQPAAESPPSGDLQAPPEPTEPETETYTEPNP
jgi:predicted small lipoprotein YifL